MYGQERARAFAEHAKKYEVPTRQATAKKVATETLREKLGRKALEHEVGQLVPQLIKEIDKERIIPKDALS